MARVRPFVTFRELTSARGRCTRVQYLVYGIGSLALLLVLPFGIGGLLSLFGPPHILDLNLSTILTRFTILTAVLVACLVVYVLFCITAKRLHDLNLPAVTGLLLFGGTVSDAIVTFGDAYVPLDGDLADFVSLGAYIVAGLMVLALCVWPGKKGENRYGTDPGIDEPAAEASET